MLAAIGSDPGADPKGIKDWQPEENQMPSIYQTAQRYLDLADERTGISAQYRRGNIGLWDYYENCDRIESEQDRTLKLAGFCDLDDFVGAALLVLPDLETWIKLIEDGTWRFEDTIINSTLAILWPLAKKPAKGYESIPDGWAFAVA